jgi:hypothetical protein
VSKAKKPRKPVEEEYRSMTLCEREVDWLLKLSKKVHFPSGLQARLVDKKLEFQDQMLKVKEILVRAKANSFWAEEATAVQQMIDDERKKKKAQMKELYQEIAFLPASKILALLNKEKLKSNVAANKKRSKAGSNGRK